ncbi:MAG: hydroxymethylglutaryl-CoA reductase, partial [Mameliella sp.]|nr:hydroxymethylglutaryl-CoA reductase [Phaeodactylibacter sp.]
LQRVFDGFSENTVSNHFLPFGIAPNFIINDSTYAVPMVLEESSVVAAASSAAKFWSKRGGFRAEVLSTLKVGQVHFTWTGDGNTLKAAMPAIEQRLREDTSHITANMEKRGGGIREIELVDLTQEEPGYYQLRVTFETCDSMGANFINSVLEEFGMSLQRLVSHEKGLNNEGATLEIIMAILSNYTPECVVRTWVECPVSELEAGGQNMDASTFAEKFAKAIRIAQIDPYRATTHNKGIFNGIDAVVLATANDFRAIEACGHAYAARDGRYRSLSNCTIEDGIFKFWMDLPLAVGTVGGLTRLHPIARLSLEMLGQPSAEELMKIIAVTGLAQNFAAVRSLVTTGIQKGHMKMHLQNILNHLKATPEEQEKATNFFADKVVSFTAVRDYIKQSRNDRLMPEEFLKK